MQSGIGIRRSLPPLTRRSFVARATIAGTSLAALGPLRIRGLAAHEGSHAEVGSELAIVSRDYAFDLPASIAGGLAAVTLDNQGADFHHAMLVRHNDGVTTDQLLAALEAAGEASLGDLAVIYGGPMVGPGGHSKVIVDLPAGTYTALCVIPGPDGMPHYKMGMVAGFEVTEPTATAELPVADRTIELMEMMFHGPFDGIAAGSTIWEVANKGGTVHELAIAQLAEGFNADQFLDFLLTPPSATPAAAPAGPPPFALVGGVAPMTQGITNYLEIDFTPGDYVAICMVGDQSTGAPHAALGMTMPFTVA